MGLRYEVVEILVNGRKVVGYKLRDIYGTVSNYSFEQALKLAKQGSIVNATYNKYRQGLDGTRGIKLSALKRTQYTGKLGQSNHELMDTYNTKLQMLGKRGFRYRKLDNDRVRLESVLDQDDTGTIEIPTFITDFGPTPFEGCKFTRIIIHNSPRISMSASELCKLMWSESIEVGFDYPTSVTSMTRMFTKCIKARHIKLLNKDFRNVKSMQGMFEGCIELQSIDISGLNLYNVDDMGCMFDSCFSLLSANLSNINTHELKYMARMFNECINLKQVDLSKINTNRVAFMADMFHNCEMIQILDLSSFKASRYVDARSMFDGCCSLRGINMINFGLTDGNVDNMFNNCNKLNQLLSSSNIIQEAYRNRKAS